MKKALSLILSLIMVLSTLSLISVSSFAEVTVIDSIDITVDFDKLVLNTVYTEGEVRDMLKESVSVDTETFRIDNMYLMYKNTENNWNGTGTGENQVDIERYYAIDVEVSLKKGFDWIEEIKVEGYQNHLSDCPGFTLTVNNKEYEGVDFQYNASWNLIDFYIPIGYPSDEQLIEPIYFPDVKESDWFYDAVQYCADKEFITGYKNGKFGPADALQRQDFVVILARIAGADVDDYTSCKLTDVDMKAYYGKAVAWAVDKGIIGGYQNGKFGVGDKITREQVATILYRYMGSPDVDTGILNKFTDKGSISAFALNAIAWANENGVINGKTATTLAPTATASRAEIATIIMRMDQQGMFSA